MRPGRGQVPRLQAPGPEPPGENSGASSTSNPARDQLTGGQRRRHLSPDPARPSLAMLARARARDTNTRIKERSPPMAITPKKHGAGRIKAGDVTQRVGVESIESRGVN